MHLLYSALFIYNALVYNNMYQKHDLVDSIALRLYILYKDKKNLDNCSRNLSDET